MKFKTGVGTLCRIVAFNFVSARGFACFFCLISFVGTVALGVVASLAGLAGAGSAGCASLTMELGVKPISLDSSNIDGSAIAT